MKRRSFLKGIGTACAITITGCVGSQDPETVRWILNPQEGDDVDITEQFSPLFEHVEESANVDIETDVVTDYAATTQALVNDQAEIAGVTAVAIAASDAVDIIGIQNSFGSTFYFSLITTTPNSEMGQLSDLEGSKIALADRLSVSGSFFPLYNLQRAGLDIGDAPEGDAEDFEVEYSNHSAAISSLSGRTEFEAAGTAAFVAAGRIPQEQFSEQFAEYSANYDDAGTSDESSVKLLHESEPIPNAPFMARSSWDSSTRDDVEEALLSATEEELIDPDAENELWFTSVEPGSIEDYEPVMNVVNTLGIEFEDIG